MKLKQIVLLIFLGLLITACSQQAMQMTSAPAYSGRESGEAAFDAPMVEEMSDTAAISADLVSDSANNVTQSKVQQQTTQERLIIRTGNMSIVVKDTELSMDDIAVMVDGMGGWVVESNVYESGVAKRGRMMVRIPAEQFDQVIDQIRKDAIDVEDESTSGQDVTEEFVDISARLANLEATADRVRGFLDETRNVEEALEVSRELSRLESEIEAFKGRIKYLSESADFSTLSISLTPDALNQPIQIAGWHPQGVARDAVQALIATMQNIGSFLIWFFIYILPILLIAAVVIYLLRAVLRKIGFKRPSFRRRKKTDAVKNVD